MTTDYPVGEALADAILWAEAGATREAASG